jgi:hypothetical protein
MGTALDTTLRLSKAASLLFGEGGYDTLSWEYHRFNEVINRG